MYVAISFLHYTYTFTNVICDVNEFTCKNCLYYVTHILQCIFFVFMPLNKIILIRSVMMIRILFENFIHGLIIQCIRGFQLYLNSINTLTECHVCT